MAQAVFRPRPGNSPPACFEVDLAPFHAHDFAATLQGQEPELQTRGREQAILAVRLVTVAQLVERLPHAPDFVLGEHALAPAVLRGRRDQVYGIRLDDFGEDTPVENFPKQGADAVRHDRRRCGLPVE